MPHGFLPTLGEWYSKCSPWQAYVNCLKNKSMQFEIQSKSKMAKFQTQSFKIYFLFFFSWSFLKLTLLFWSNCRFTYSRKKKYRASLCTLAQFIPMTTAHKTREQDHKQDTDMDTVKTENVFTVTRIPHISLLQPRRFPPISLLSSLTPTNSPMWSSLYFFLI